MSLTKALTAEDMKGWLHKWTNYLKGYKKRWFVLSNGVLSYYRTQTEMTHTCRGTINLHGAFIHNEDAFSFIVSNNGGTQAFHLKATNAMEKYMWITALQTAKEGMELTLGKEDCEDGGYRVNPVEESISYFKSLVNVLEGLKTYNSLVAMHGIALGHALTNLEDAQSEKDALERIDVVNEKSNLFRITSNSMINKCNEFLTKSQEASRNWQKMLLYERDLRQILQDMLEQLAMQHNVLQQATNDKRLLQANEILVKSKIEIPPAPKNLDTETDDSFYGAFDEDDENNPPDNEELNLIVNNEGKNIVIEDQASHKSKLSQMFHSMTSESSRPSGTHIHNKVQKQRRVRVPEMPDHPANLWTILKKSLGKDLSKITIPVSFSEPLSALQRLTEDFEYSEILDIAADMDDPDMQLAYVATFTITGYSSTAYRTKKPFNPLLGETYECDRRQDHGWKVISEQVSHNPPIAAHHCESKNWVCWQEMSVASKIRSNYLQITPFGTCHLIFKKTGHHISWKKVTTLVKNIVVGTLRVDQVGDTDVINHNTESKCRLNYVESSLFSRDARRKVKGCVLDKNGEALWAVSGNWDTNVEIAKVTSTGGSKDSPVYQLQDWIIVWQVKGIPEDSEKYYNFSVFACQLNEMEDGVAPTDSRLRPDQRLMENGKWDEANEVKERLEEKQRAIREQKLQEHTAFLERQIKEMNEYPKTSVEESKPETVRSGDMKNVHPPHNPLWFKRELEPVTDEVTHVYKGGYWEAKKRRDWSMCPDLF